MVDRAAQVQVLGLGIGEDVLQGVDRTARRDARMAVAGKSGSYAGREESASLEGEQGDLPAQHRGVDKLASSGLLADVECAADRVGGEHAGPDVRDRNSELGRHPTWM